MRAAERLERQDIGRSAGENEKRFGIFAELGANRPRRGLAPGIAAVTDRISRVGPHDRRQDLRMNARAIVAGEAE
jgi:hypothetical protein